MADSQKQINAPSVGNNPRQKPKNKHAEKIAANQLLPVESLIEEFLRQEFLPDPNDGNNYYVGKVLQIIEENNTEFDIFDIFNNSVNNLERFYSSYKTQNKVVTHQYVVHIPELFSTTTIDGGGQFLNYYTKFKINYSGNDSIKVNDLVKIVFKNAKTYSDPEIVSVYRSDGNENRQVDLSGNLVTSLADYTRCRNLQLQGSQAPNANLNSSFIEGPVAGYYQLFDTLNYIFSPTGFKTFSRLQGPKPLLDPSTITFEIFCDSKVKELAKNNNNLINKFVEDSKGVPEVVVGEDNGRSSFEVLLRLTNVNKDLLENFSKFIDKQLFKFRFSIIIGSIKDSKKNTDPQDSKYLDLSIDVQAVGLELNEASVDTYIATSEKLKSGGVSSNNSNTEAQQIGQSILAQNSTFDPCESVQPTVTDLYIPISGSQRWTRSSADGPFIKYFFDGSDTAKTPYSYQTELKAPEDLLREENLYISGELIKDKKTLPFYSYEDLKKINNKFYFIPEKVKQTNTKKNLNIGINSNFTNGKDNFISEESLASRIAKISDFLITLRSLIIVNEGVENSDVLVLPINVLRAKKVNKQDTESRHYYGQAVDFVVYIRINQKIYQIPSVYVYLYCVKVVESFNQKENSGFGVFIDEEYNHFEYLGFTFDELSPSTFKSGLSASERQNGRLWINAGNIEELRKLDSQPIDKKERGLKDYILKNIGPTPVQKILRLI